MVDVIIATNEVNFKQDVLEADLALVDFWAEWCSPCKMIAPIFQSVAQEYADKLKFVKLDVEKNPDIAAKYGIQGIPTLLLFKGGKVCATKVGLLTRTELVDFLQAHI